MVLCACRFLWFFIWLITLTFSAFLVLKNPFEVNISCNQVGFVYIHIPVCDLTSKLYVSFMPSSSSAQR